MSLKSARDAGTRRPAKQGGKSLLAPTLGVHTTELGESRENLSQKHALEAQFTTSPAVNAAKTVLHSQLLQGGLKLVRNGEDAKPVKFGETDATTGQRKKGITPDFQQHLNAYWLPFAKDLVDSFLKWGLVAVVFQEMPEDTHGEALAKLKREIGMAVDDATIKRKRDQPKVLIPLVPMLGTYEIAWRFEGTFGYSRQYILYNNAPGHATRADPTARVFVREHPDNVGNLNSPLATVYQQGSFVSSLVEMAFQAELSRTTPSIVTQLRKPEKGADLSAGALFFDADSRNLAAGQDGEESSKAARDLELQAQLCRVINSMQTQGSRGDGPGSSSAAPRFSPPDVAPKLFTLPKDHELAPHVQIPQPRGDLEALIRLSIDQFCSALGVPASLVFEGKFLLNSTVAQLAKATNDVLTSVYRSLYGDDDGDEEPAELKLVTSPLAAAEEIERLFTAQLIDRETALPAALHALGATSDEIESALERGKARDDKQCACEDADREFQKNDQKLQLKEREAGLATTKEKNRVDLEQAKANVDKTKKETTELGKKPPSLSDGSK